MKDTDCGLKRLISICNKNMNFQSKKTALIILGVTALLISRAIFWFFNDPEGPNLLIVFVMAAILYFLSLATYSFNRSSSSLKKLLLAIFIQIIVAVGVSFIFSDKNSNNDIPKATTDTSQNGWLEFSDEERGITFQYPENFKTIYVDPIDWPPSFQVLDSSYTCTMAGSPIESAGRTEELIINGDKYCVTATKEGAAGSAYIQYAYAFAESDKTLILTFTVREPQCANYPSPEQELCEEGQSLFNPDELIGKIRENLVFSEPK